MEKKGRADFVVGDFRSSCTIVSVCWHFKNKSEFSLVFTDRTRHGLLSFQDNLLAQESVTCLLLVRWALHNKAFSDFLICTFLCLPVVPCSTSVDSINSPWFTRIHNLSSVTCVNVFFPPPPSDRVKSILFTSCLHASGPWAMTNTNTRLPFLSHGVLG